MDSHELSKISMDYLDPFYPVAAPSDRLVHRAVPLDQQAGVVPSMSAGPNGSSTINPVTRSDVSDGDRNSTIDLLSIYYDTIAFENTVSIVIPTIYSLIIFIGLVGNVLVITVVLLNRHMRNSTNILIVNLAIADLLFLVFCVPFTAADYALPIWVFSYSWCQILQYLQYVTAYASVWTLVLMAFDRFLAVCLPVQSLTLRTVRNTLCVSSAVWILIVLLNVPLLKVYGIHRYYFILEDRASCTFVGQANRTASETQVQLHHLSFVTWGYLLPLSISCIFYYFMLRRLWWGMPAVRLGSRASEESIRAKKKVTWMVSGVITTFAICWAPLNTCFAISALSYRQHGEAWAATKTFVIIQFASQILAYANSCLNPILYAFLSENFRKGFYKICGFLLCCAYSKFEFERTNEFGANTTGRLSTPYTDTGRLSLSTASRLLPAGYRQGRQRMSLIPEEQKRRSSCVSVNDFPFTGRSVAERSSAHAVTLYRNNRSSSASNGDVAPARSANQDDDQCEHLKFPLVGQSRTPMRRQSTNEEKEAMQLLADGREIGQANL